MGGSKLRDFGDPYSANVILPKQLLIETIKSAVSTDAGPGVEDRQVLAERMMLALDEGYEGFGWQVFESGRALGAELKATLAKSLLDYFNDPMVPTSGDELTFFMTKEIMNRLAPSLLVVNFWDIDIAHYGAYSLYLEAIRRTDRLVHELWQHAQSLPPYRDRRRCWWCPSWGATATSLGNGFANHRSGDESCRRVWLVALGAGVPKGAGTERPIRTTDVAPTVARILGVQDAGVRRPAAPRAGVLSIDAMPFDARLTGDAATLARRARAMLERLPATVPRVRSSSSCEKWPTLFAAEQRYQRALLEHLAGCRPPSAIACSRASRRSKPRPAATGSAPATPAAFPGRGAGAAAQAAAAARRGGGKSTPSSRRSSRRSSAAVSRRWAAPAGRPALRQRHRRAARASCGAASRAAACACR